MCCSDLLDRYGVKLNVVGRKDLLPPHVRAAADKAESITRNNTTYVMFCVLGASGLIGRATFSDPFSISACLTLLETSIHHACIRSNHCGFCEDDPPSHDAYGKRTVKLTQTARGIFPYRYSPI